MALAGAREEARWAVNDQVEVRPAMAADREAVGRLWQEMMEFHRECDPRFFRLKPEALDIWIEHLDECLLDTRQFVLVAEASGELVGFAMGRPNEDPPVFESPPHGFVTNFAVTEAWRGKGVGRRLFEAAVEEFRKRGFAEVRLSMAALNPVSDAFWRKLGFEPYQVYMRREVQG